MSKKIKKLSFSAFVLFLLICFNVSFNPFVSGWFIRIGGEKAFAATQSIIPGFDDVWVSSNNYNLNWVGSCSYYTNCFVIRRVSDCKLFFGVRFKGNNSSTLLTLNQSNYPRLTCWNKNDIQITAPAIDTSISIIPSAGYYVTTWNNQMLFVYPFDSNIGYYLVGGACNYLIQNSNQFNISDGTSSIARIEKTDIRQYANQQPMFSVTFPTINTMFSDLDTSVSPQITVSDVDNNNVTCKLYLDSATTPLDTKVATNTRYLQTVDFSPIDFSQSDITQGIHTLKFEICDGIGAPITSTVSFTVDKTLPVLGTVSFVTSVNSATISGSATDSISGLAALPYRYTVLNSSDEALKQSNWMSATTCNVLNNLNYMLTPNTLYKLRFEARDAEGHIQSFSKNMYTLADMPSLSLVNFSSTTVEAHIADSNHSSTEYQIKTGARFVTSAGELTTIPTWITLQNKAITITGLSPDTSYDFQVKSKNGDNVETEFSSLVSSRTAVAPPGVPTATATSNAITISWNAVDGAIGYIIKVDGVEIDNGSSTTYVHSGLSPNTKHMYYVKAVTIQGNTDWSPVLKKGTLGPEYTLNCTAGKQVLFVLKASNITDYSQKSFTVTYNTEELEVTDLCTATKKKELITGDIPGTNVIITQYVPGKVTFVIVNPVAQGKSKSGPVNSISFKAKINGQSKIVYTVE
ncbi:MAG: hypothetical protein N3I35_19715 [Clostridia bacterium]|nr:hypothetical protein [Clostridia bacterium]